MREHEIGEWILTDDSVNQWGREIGNGVFEFKQDEKYDEFLSRTIQFEVDLKHYTEQEIESAISTFGYTLHPHRYKGSRSIYDVYGKNTAWICAECIFELELFENL